MLLEGGGVAFYRGGALSVNHLALGHLMSKGWKGGGRALVIKNLWEKCSKFSQMHNNGQKKL